MRAGVWLLCRIVCDSIETVTYYFDARVTVNVAPWHHAPDVKVWTSPTSVHVDLHQAAASVFIAAQFTETTGERAEGIIAKSIARWKARRERAM